MKSFKLTSTVLSLFCGLALLLSFQVGYAKPESKKIKTKEKAGGPPAWAPAHGYRRKFQYWPQQKVYYDGTKKQYFWLQAGNIKVGSKLPSWIQIAGAGTTKELDAEAPLLIHFK